MPFVATTSVRKLLLLVLVFCGFDQTQRSDDPWSAVSDLRLYGADVYVPISMLNTSAKDVLNAVDQYWPPRQR